MPSNQKCFRKHVVVDHWLEVTGHHECPEVILSLSKQLQFKQRFQGGKKKKARCPHINQEILDSLSKRSAPNPSFILE